MDWEKLLKPLRQEAFPEAADPRANYMDNFSIDAERIIYTTVFRRLQGKTQVYPLPIYDYLRTRLTHTNEVANVGRNLATLAGEQVKKNCGALIEPVLLGKIVYAACLAHDLGNPPFGHSGEEAIRDWFEQRVDVEPFSEVLKEENKAQRNDFLHFDGNAQGFRILTELSTWGGKGGMRLTYPVLAAFSKYPYPSVFSSDKKKYGYQQINTAAANLVFEGLGIKRVEDKDIEGSTITKWARHPLAYIVEAADDISYLTSDVDDAHRMGHLGMVAAKGLLETIINLRSDVANEVKSVSGDRERISYLRTVAATTLLKASAEIFMQQYNAILNGNFSSELLEMGEIQAVTSETKKLFRDEVFRSQYKLQLEAVGYNVILGLMDLFGGMIKEFLLRGGADKMGKRNENLFYLLPKESRDRMASGAGYDCMLVLTDYVSGMTDRYALDLYQKLYGNSAALGKMN